MFITFKNVPTNNMTLVLLTYFVSTSQFMVQYEIVVPLPLYINNLLET